MVAGGRPLRTALHRKGGRHPYANPEIGFYFAGVHHIDEQSKLVDAPSPLPLKGGRIECKEMVNYMSRNGSVNAIAPTVLKRRCYEEIGFQLQYDGMGDFVLFLKMAAHWPVWYHPEPVAAVRFHAGQHSRRIEAADNGDDEVLFNEIENLTFLDDDQVRSLVEWCMEHSRRRLNRALWSPGCSTADLIGEYRRFTERFNGWQESGKPYARHVRVMPQKGLRSQLHGARVRFRVDCVS